MLSLSRYHSETKSVLRVESGLRSFSGILTNDKHQHATLHVLVVSPRIHGVCVLLQGDASYVEVISLHIFVDWQRYPCGVIMDDTCTHASCISCA